MNRKIFFLLLGTCAVKGRVSKKQNKTRKDSLFVTDGLGDWVGQK